MYVCNDLNKIIKHKNLFIDKIKYPFSWAQRFNF